MSAPGHDFTKDTSPAPGIVVTASTEERVDHAIPGQTGITGRDGHYVIPNLPPGAYHVILFKNCNNAIREDVTVAAGKTTVVDLKYGVDAQIL